MTDCLFCKIIEGKIPSRKVYEDDTVFAFLDIAPVNLGHTLILPKAHHASMADTPDEELASLLHIAKRVASAALEVTGATGYNIGINNGAVAGQVIMHTHVHVIPRREGDGLTHWPKRPVTDDEMDRTAAMMSETLTT